MHAQGENWKFLRKRYNMGFAPQHLITLLKPILAKTDIFLNKLDNFAHSGVEFNFDVLCVNLTFDIIGERSSSSKQHRNCRQMLPRLRLFQ